MPAAVQISAANTITFSDSQFVNLGQTAIGIGNDANAHASGVGLGASNITVTRSEIARSSAGGIVVGGVRADAHHPSDQRMVNRDITISNNRIHDLGADYRGIVSVLTTYVTNGTVSHNEVYNMPYSGMSIGYGWGANDAGGSNHYANRGLYNYQPRYTTPTTASNNRLIGNYVHDVMQQMNDGGCIYTLGWNPSALISRNYCLRTNGYFGLYFDEGSKYYTATNNVFSNTGTWATANYWGGENMGNWTVTNNWSTNGSTNVTNGDRGNVVSGNVTVTNGNWPSGAQAVMASAGPQGAQHHRRQRLADRGRAVRPLPRRPAAPAPPTAPRPSSGTAPARANQTWTYTAGKQLTVYGTKCLDASGRAPPTAPPSSSGTATARPTSSGTSTPTAPSPASSPDCASTPTAPAPPTAPRSSSGPATAAPTSSGHCDSGINACPLLWDRSGCRRRGPSGCGPRRASRSAILPAHPLSGRGLARQAVMVGPHAPGPTDDAARRANP